ERIVQIVARVVFKVTLEHKVRRVVFVDLKVDTSGLSIAIDRCRDVEVQHLREINARSGAVAGRWQPAQNAALNQRVNRHYAAREVEYSRIPTRQIESGAGQRVNGDLLAGRDAHGTVPCGWWPCARGRVSECAIARLRQQRRRNGCCLRPLAKDFGVEEEKRMVLEDPRATLTETRQRHWTTDRSSELIPVQEWLWGSVQVAEE